MLACPSTAGATTAADAALLPLPVVRSPPNTQRAPHLGHSTAIDAPPAPPPRPRVRCHCCHALTPATSSPDALLPRCRLRRPATAMKPPRRCCQLEMRRHGMVETHAAVPAGSSCGHSPNQGSSSSLASNTFLAALRVLVGMGSPAGVRHSESTSRWGAPRKGSGNRRTGFSSTSESWPGAWPVEEPSKFLRTPGARRNGRESENGADLHDAGAAAGGTTRQCSRRRNAPDGQLLGGGGDTLGPRLGLGAQVELAQTTLQLADAMQRAASRHVRRSARSGGHGACLHAPRGCGHCCAPQTHLPDVLQLDDARRLHAPKQGHGTSRIHAKCARCVATDYPHRAAHARGSCSAAMACQAGPTRGAK